MTGSLSAARLEEIRRTHRHATATRPTETDSWLNGYQTDVRELLAEVERQRERATAARDVLSELTAYFEIDELPPEVQDRMSEALDWGINLPVDEARRESAS